MAREGDALAADGEFEAALFKYDEALREDELVNRHHPRVAMRYCSVGALYRATGDVDAALEYFAKAVQVEEMTERPERRTALASYLSNLGGAYRAAGDAETASRHYCRALDHIRRIIPPLPDVPAVTAEESALFEREMALGETSPLHDPLNDPSEPTLEDTSKLLGPSGALNVAASVLNNLGLLYKSLGEPHCARRLYARSIALATIAVGEFDPAIGTRVRNLGAALLALGHVERAVEKLDKARTCARWGSARPPGDGGLRAVARRRRGGRGGRRPGAKLRGRREPTGDRGVVRHDAELRRPRAAEGAPAGGGARSVQADAGGRRRRLADFHGQDADGTGSARKRGEDGGGGGGEEEDERRAGLGRTDDRPRSERGFASFGGEPFVLDAKKRRRRKNAPLGAVGVSGDPSARSEGAQRALRPAGGSRRRGHAHAVRAARGDGCRCGSEASPVWRSVARERADIAGGGGAMPRGQDYIAAYLKQAPGYANLITPFQEMPGELLMPYSAYKGYGVPRADKDSLPRLAHAPKGLGLFGDETEERRRETERGVRGRGGEAEGRGFGGFEGFGGVPAPD